MFSLPHVSISVFSTLGCSESSTKGAFVNAKALWLAMTGEGMLLPFYLMLWNQDTKCPAI